MTRLLAILLSVALLLPALGGTLAVMAGAQVVVLCIGSERVRVTLDADGTPVAQAPTLGTDCLTAPAQTSLARAESSVRRDVPATRSAVAHLPHAMPIPDQNPARAPPLSA